MNIKTYKDNNLINSQTSVKMMTCFYFSIPSSLTNESFFIIDQIHNQKQFRNTIQTRAYNLSDLVGMVGGYIGLFMGYSLTQFPDFMRMISFWIKKRNVESFR